MTEKLQKILSRAGIASRRALEQMIDQGRVNVNGSLAKVGDRYDANNIVVKIDGKVVLSPDSQKVACRVLMYHKPEGELTTLSDPENRPTVFDHIPKPPTGRWIYIGRLDINTSGLLLFTTDGELANALMHPKYEVERVYAARIYGEVSEEQIEQLQSGVQLEDGKASFNKIAYVGGEGRNMWYHVTLKEGRKREVRRLWEAVGLKVSRLIRIKYAGIELDPNLKTGQYRELTLNEINKLRRSVRLDPLEQLAPSLNLDETNSTLTKKINRARPNTSRGSVDFKDKRRDQNQSNRASSKNGRDDFRKGKSFGKNPSRSSRDFDKNEKFSNKKSFGGARVVSRSSYSKEKERTYGSTQDRSFSRSSRRNTNIRVERVGNFTNR